jgi:hypothetical protein
MQVILIRIPDSGTGVESTLFGRAFEGCGQMIAGSVARTRDVHRRGLGKLLVEAGLGLRCAMVLDVRLHGTLNGLVGRLGCRAFFNILGLIGPAAYACPESPTSFGHQAPLSTQQN